MYALHEEFKPSYQNLNIEESKILTEITLIEHEKGSDFFEEKHVDSFLNNVIKKRIETFNLPIKFNNATIAVMPAYIMCNTGRAIALLVDILNTVQSLEVHERWFTHLQTDTLNELVWKDHEVIEIKSNLLSQEIYPTGLYTEKTFTEYVEVYLKPNMVNWAEIY